MRASYALLREDAGLVHPESLFSFGVITEAERDFFLKVPIQVWLLGQQALPGNELSQLVWNPHTLDLSCLDGEDLTGVRRSVVYAVSRQVL